MTTIGQVWHVARKDVTQWRWWLVGYAVLAVVTTLTASQIVPNAPDGMTTLFAPALWLLGGVIAALLVQSDAPANPRAFWASQPIETRALLMAKLSLAGVVILLPPLLGEIAALRYFGITGDEFGSLLSRAVWVYGGWLLLAMLVAALTRRFAGFFAAIIAVPVVFTVIGITLSQAPWQLGTAWIPRALLQVVATAGSAALLTLVYRRRTATRPLLGVAAVVLAAGLLAITRREALAERPALESATAPGVALEIASFDANRLLRDRELFLQITATGMRAPYRYAFLTDSASATFSDGTTTPLWAPLFIADVPRLFGGSRPGADIGSVMVMLPQRSPEPRRTGTVTSFRIFGAVESLTGKRVVQLQSNGRGEFRDGDMRLQVVGGEDGGAGVSLHMTTVYRTGVDIRDVFALRRRYTAQLVWPNRADTVELALGNVSDEERMLVLPGASVHRVSMRPNRDLRLVPDSLPAPLAEASLELIRWTPVSRRPITVTRAVP